MFDVFKDEYTYFFSSYMHNEFISDVVFKKNQNNT